MENKKNDWKDPLYLDELLTEEEKSISIKIKEYCQNKLLPSVIENNNKSIFDKNFYPDLGALGFLGNTIKGYGSKKHMEGIKKYGIKLTISRRLMPLYNKHIF